MQQDQSDNRLYHFPTQKGRGIIGTILFHVVVITILIIAGFTSKVPEIEEGLLVNFGTDELGSGLIEPSAGAASDPASQPIVSPPQPATKEEAINTQEFEEAPVVKKVVKTDPEAEKKRLEEIEAEKVKRAEIEAAKKKAELEEIERKRIEADQKRAQEAMDRTKNALAGINTGTTSTGEGVTTGTGNQGVKNRIGRLPN